MAGSTIKGDIQRNGFLDKSGNGVEGQVRTLNASDEEVWADSDGSAHTIVDNDGVSFTNRTNLQFTGISINVADNAAEDTTIVSVDESLLEILNVDSTVSQSLNSLGGETITVAGTLTSDSVHPQTSIRKLGSKLYYVHQFSSISGQANGVYSYDISTNITTIEFAGPSTVFAVNSDASIFIGGGNSSMISSAGGNITIPNSSSFIPTSTQLVDGVAYFTTDATSGTTANGLWSFNPTISGSLSAVNVKTTAQIRTELDIPTNPLAPTLGGEVFLLNELVDGRIFGLATPNTSSGGATPSSFAIPCIFDPTTETFSRVDAGDPTYQHYFYNMDTFEIYGSKTSNSNNTLDIYKITIGNTEEELIGSIDNVSGLNIGAFGLVNENVIFGGLLPAITTDDAIALRSLTGMDVNENRVLERCASFQRILTQNTDNISFDGTNVTFLTSVSASLQATGTLSNTGTYDSDDQRVRFKLTRGGSDTFLDTHLVDSTSTIDTFEINGAFQFQNNDIICVEGFISDPSNQTTDYDSSLDAGATLVINSLLQIRDLPDLLDVASTTTSSATNGQVLTYNETNSVWENQTLEVGEDNTASNLGDSSDGEGLVGTKNGVDLPFKRIKAGTNITLTSEANDVVINATSGGGGLRLLSGINTSGSDINIWGGTSISTSGITQSSFIPLFIDTGFTENDSGTWTRNTEGELVFEVAGTYLVSIQGLFTYINNSSNYNISVRTVTDFFLGTRNTSGVISKIVHLEREDVSSVSARRNFVINDSVTFPVTVSVGDVVGVFLEIDVLTLGLGSILSVGTNEGQLNENRAISAYGNI